MKAPPFLAFALAATLSCQAAAVAGEISVLTWGIGSEVDTFVDLDRAFSLAPVNPYQATLIASLGPTRTSVSDFDITWSNQTFDFHMGAAHQLLDVASIHSAFSRSVGSLTLQSDQPLQVCFDLEYQYDIPGSAFESSSLFSMQDQTNDILLFGEAQEGGPLDLEPPTGVFNIQGAIDVPANVAVVINYSMRIRTIGGNSNVVGQANGSLNIHIQTIPEPATCAMLGISVPVALLCRRRRLDWSPNGTCRIEPPPLPDASVMCRA